MLRPTFLCLIEDPFLSISILVWDLGFFSGLFLWAQSVPQLLPDEEGSLEVCAEYDG